MKCTCFCTMKKHFSNGACRGAPLLKCGCEKKIKKLEKKRTELDIMIIQAKYYLFRLERDDVDFEKVKKGIDEMLDTHLGHTD